MEYSEVNVSEIFNAAEKNQGKNFVIKSEHGLASYNNYTISIDNPLAFTVRSGSLNPTTLDFETCMLMEYMEMLDMHFFKLFYDKYVIDLVIE